MFHPDVIAAKEARLLRRSPALAAALPGGCLTRYTVSDVRTYLRRFEADVDEKGQLRRNLTAAEQAFVMNEMLLTKLDWKYFAERYAWINSEGSALQPLYPLWQSQDLLLSAIAAIELKQHRARSHDGVLVTLLKAAQIGGSTMTQAIIIHRAITHGHVLSLIAADVPDQSVYLFDMAMRVYDHLPFYLRPDTVFREKGRHLILANESLIRVESGKSMRGALKEDRKQSQKGQMGRGKTFSAVHLSELSTWEHPEQLNYSLFPRIPVQPASFCCAESTAKGRHNWWHTHWTLSVAGKNRFTPVFIPWYAIAKYAQAPPPIWVPSPKTLEVAKRIIHTSARWLGVTTQPSREQLYWYETRREESELLGLLADFLAEYPTEPEEAFQHSGRSIFTPQVLERVETQLNPLVDCWTVNLTPEMAAVRSQR